MRSPCNFVTCRKLAILTLSIFSATIVAVFPIDSSAFFHENLFGSQPTASSDDFITYQDYSAGITMKYPSDWQKIEEAGVKAFRERNGMAVFAIYTDPVELPQIITNYPDLIQLQLAEDKKATTESLTNSRLIESNMTTIDGNPASKLIFLKTENIEGQDVTYRFIQLETIKNDTRYSFMIAISPTSHDRMMPIVQKMIDSIKLTAMY